MKRFKIEIYLSTEDNINAEDIQLDISDEIDGFELTRTDHEGDVTGEFYLKSADIETITEVEVPEPTLFDNSLPLHRENPYSTAANSAYNAAAEIDEAEQLLQKGNSDDYPF